jgi:[ribosomal protein S5]-alanine N-acetyltransferase
MRSYFMRTSRLGFSTWSADDLALGIGLWGDASVTRLIGGPFSPQWIEERLALEISNQSRYGYQYWPVFRLSDEAHVGCAGLRPVSGSEDVLELGFHLRPEYWGQGFATEASRAVIRYAFATALARALVAGHHPQNEASRRVLQRLGFRHTGDEYYAPTRLDHPTYRLTAAEFAQASPPGP